MRLPLASAILLAVPTAAAMPAPIMSICPFPWPAKDVCVVPGTPEATGLLVGLGLMAAVVVATPYVVIWKVWLRWMPFMGGFTRLRRDRLLDQPVRADLYARIEAQPGIHYQALVEASGKAKGAVSHHLATLVRGDVVTAIRNPGFSSYFVRGALDAPVMAGLATVKAPAAADALRNIASEPGLGTREVARRIGIHESTLRHHMRRFQDTGLVDPAAGLHLTELGARVVAHIPDDFGMPQQPPGVS